MAAMLTEAPGGEEQYRPFHVQSMRQATAEGFILDLLQPAGEHRGGPIGPDDPRA